MSKSSKKTVSYVSKSKKRYNIAKTKTLNVKRLVYLLVIPSIVVLVLALILLFNSMTFGNTSIFVQYNELGKVSDYKVYLKPNDQYSEKYLGSGMEYVSSFINTINPTYKYEFHSTENMEFSYTYRIDAELLVYKTDDNTPLIPV